MTTPSGLARESACLTSVVLPHARSTGPRAVRGSDLHAFMCAVVKDGLEEALAGVPLEWRAAAQAIDFSKLPDLHPDACIAEVAIAWNADTGEARELGRNGTVEHDDLADLLGPGEIGGIADYVALTPSSVYVLDFKFGYASIERAETNQQLSCYAVMTAALYGREAATVCIARIFDNGDVWNDSATLDEMNLIVTRANIRRHLQRAEEAKQGYRSSGIIPTPVEGGHCRYCPALPFCPAKTALLLSAFSNGEKEPAALARLPEPLTEEVAASLWTKLKLAEQLIERLKSNVKDFARQYGPIELPNGNVLAEGETVKESINALWARPALYQRFGAEETEFAIESTMTKKALDELCAKHSSHGKKAKLVREVLAELADAGAMRSVTVRGVAESRPTAKRLKAANE